MIFEVFIWRASDGVIKWTSPKHSPKDSTPAAATQEADEVTRGRGTGFLQFYLS